MGTSLAGSQILGTYSGLLKTTDNAALNATLRTISDGIGTDSAFKLATGSAQVAGTFDVTGAFTLGGNFSVATNKFTVNATSGNTLVAGTLDSTGNFAVATNKFTVAAASGNTAVAGTLNVTGNFTGSQGVTGRSLTASDAAGTSALAGGLTVGTTSVFAGQATFNGLVIFNAALTFNAGITAPTVTATTSSALGTASCGSLTSTGFVSVGGNLSVTGNITGNGNVTIGDAAGDALTLNAATWTTPNIPTATLDAANDFVLIRDVSDSNRVKLVTAASFAGTTFNSGNIAISGLTVGSPSVSGNWSQVQIPDRVQFWFRCKTAHSGFLVGDRLPVGSVYVSGTGEPFFQLHYNDSGWALYRAGYAATPEFKTALTGTALPFNLSNWDFLAIAEWTS